VGLLRYVIRRLLHALVVLLAVSLVAFVTIRLTGDPAAAMLQAGHPTKAAIAALRHALGLDRPLAVQYVLYIWGALHGNLGTSFQTGEPVAQLIASRLPATFEMAVAGVLVGIVLAFPIGVLSALRPNSWIDLAGRLFALAGISFPNFWLGIMLITIFAVDLRWFPASGYGTPASLVLPAVTLGLILAGIWARLIRSSLLEVLHQDYIRTARAKGLAPRAVIWRHALRNALIPVVTYIGSAFAALLGGIVFVEAVFAWPGIGSLALTAVNGRDFPLVQGIVLVSATFLVLANLVVDLSYLLLDPQIRLE
jgi:peptide/nickel transport system permease protein